MDTTAERQRLESDERAIKAYLDHPITRKVAEDNEIEQEKAINLITNVPVDSIEAFFNLFQAIGHLRGLRRAASIVQDDVDMVATQLKELPNE